MLNRKKVKLFLSGFLFFLFSQQIFASSIAYTDLGKGTPLILIHAFPTDERMWDPQRAELIKHFRLITLSLPGFGKSSAVNGKTISMSEYANTVKKLMEQLHIKKAIIGGESMGGYVALAFLDQYPNSVSGLILSDTQAIPDNEQAKSKREVLANQILDSGTSGFINNFIPKALISEASEQKRLLLQQILISQSPTAMASALRGMAVRTDKSNVLANTALPILIITGDQDTLISPEQSINMHALAKNSKLVTIEHAAHLSNLEQPQQWNAAVIEMFKNV